jgi:DNA-directed RNA polymerase subunit RPC12/RpoP
MYYDTRFEIIEDFDMGQKTLPYKQKCCDCSRKVSLSLLTWSEQKDVIAERKPRCPSCWSKYTPPAVQEIPDVVDLEPIFELMGVTSFEELFD